LKRGGKRSTAVFTAAASNGARKSDSAHVLQIIVNQENNLDMILLGSHTVPKEYDTRRFLGNLLYSRTFCSACIGITSLEHNKGFPFGTL